MAAVEEDVRADAQVAPALVKVVVLVLVRHLAQVLARHPVLVDALVAAKENVLIIALNHVDRNALEKP